MRSLTSEIGKSRIRRGCPRASTPMVPDISGRRCRLSHCLDGHPTAGPEGARGRRASEDAHHKTGGSVKHALMPAVALSIMLSVSSASAYTWVAWHCPTPNPNPPPPTCDSLVKAHYTCLQGH